MTYGSRLLLALLLACGGGSDKEHDSGSPGGAPSGSPVGSAGTPAGGTTTPPTSLVGVLIDPTGAPLAGTDVLCCTPATCIQQDSAADGSFSFQLVPGTHVSLKTHTDLFRMPRWGAALEPAVIPESGGLDVGSLYVPDLPAGQPLGPEGADPQELAAGDGLVLTLNRADLHPEFGVVLYDVAARRVPDAYVPDYQDLADRDVTAVYALHPFGTTSDSPIAVEAPTTLAAGTGVSFWAIDHLGGTLFGPVPGRSDGAQVTTNAGAGVALLTYLVITVP